MKKYMAVLFVVVGMLSINSCDMPEPVDAQDGGSQPSYLVNEKICTKGCACGNSCISCSETCHQGGCK